MTSVVNPSRNYDSTRRQAQARATRARVLAVARDGFVAEGYAATTIPSIAAAAETSVETIYKAFGNKSALVKAVFDVTIAGDDEPIPVEMRESIQAIQAEPDPRSEERRVGKSVDLGGRRIIKKKKIEQIQMQ